MLGVQGNIASTYEALGRIEPALRMRRDVYSGTLKHCGEQHEDTLIEANNYADALVNLERLEEAKSLLRRTRPVARRVLGESNVITLKLLWVHAQTLYKDDSATLADLRGLVNTLEDSGRIARRVFGGAHPVVAGTQYHLVQSRAALAARETPSPGSA